MEKNRKREIRQMRKILNEITGMAEEEAFPGGIATVVKRYNAILRHLESHAVLPAGLFQTLSEEEEPSYDEIGVECRLLNGYLQEDEEDESPNSEANFGPVIALAPFLEKDDLKKLVRMHLSGKGFEETESELKENRSKTPDLKILAGLAPHMPKQELTALVTACLARSDDFDPKLLLALAPHMDKQELGRLLKEHLPEWFAGKNQSETPPEPPARGTELTPAFPRTETWEVQEN